MRWSSFLWRSSSDASMAPSTCWAPLSSPAPKLSARSPLGLFLGSPCPALCPDPGRKGSGLSSRLRRPDPEAEAEAERKGEGNGEGEGEGKGEGKAEARAEQLFRAFPLRLPPVAAVASVGASAEASAAEGSGWERHCSGSGGVWPGSSSPWSEACPSPAASAAAEPSLFTTAVVPPRLVCTCTAEVAALARTSPPSGLLASYRTQKGLLSTLFEGVSNLNLRTLFSLARSGKLEDSSVAMKRSCCSSNMRRLTPRRGWPSGSTTLGYTTTVEGPLAGRTTLASNECHMKCSCFGVAK